MNRGPIPSWLETIDTRQFGGARRGAVYAVHGRNVSLVETGTARSVDVWAPRFRGANIRYIFLTHIHLDHAGGASALAAEHPEATIVVHPRGARHLVDPRRLLRGVRLASEEMFPLYGAPKPISKDRIHPVSDGEIFDLGRGLALQAVESPGHAPHHVCYFEQGSACLFSGDALGNHRVMPAVPLTVPPGYDIEKGLATLKRLAALRPAEIAYTHFGVARGGIQRIEEYRDQLVSWFEEIFSLRRTRTEDEVVAEILGRPELRGSTGDERALLAMCVRGALASRSGVE